MIRIFRKSGGGRVACGFRLVNELFILNYLYVLDGVLSLGAVLRRLKHIRTHTINININLVRPAGLGNLEDLSLPHASLAEEDLGCFENEAGSGLGIENLIQLREGFLNRPLELFGDGVVGKVLARGPPVLHRLLENIRRLEVVEPGVRHFEMISDFLGLERRIVKHVVDQREVTIF
jgi:hypothetical protein